MYEDGQIENGHRFDAATNSWIPLSAPQHVPVGQPAQAASSGMSTGKKVAIGVGGAFAGLFLIGACAAIVGGTTTTPTTDPTQVAAAPAQTQPAPTPIQTQPAPVATQPVAPAPPPQPVEPVAPAPAPEPAAPEWTVSQQNAVEKAESYLEFAGFSYQGLIDQLSSEYGDGFSKADATFAAKNVTVDWNEQAVKKAQSYLEFTSFSRNGLIEQLTSEYGDQFTKAQATYAANKVGL